MDYFGKSQKVAEETKIATAREKIQLRVAEIATDKISKENRNLKVEELIEIENNEITVQKNTDGTIYTEVDEENKEYAISECDGYKFKVYASGAVELYIDKELVQITYEKTSVSEDKSKITILITVTGNKGLEKVIKPDNLEIYPTEDRNKISIDFTADSGVDYTFKAIGKGGTEETKVINVTAGDIYTIEDLEDMKVELGLSYRLMKDLDFKDINSYKTEEKYDYYNQDTDEDGKQDNSWEPIGNSTTNFTGTFDGQFYTINNLYINSTTENTGLFGMLSGSTTSIKNLKLENVDIISTAACTGGLIGIMDGTGKVEKVGVSGKIKGTDNTGGVAGYLGNDTIEEVYSECDIEGTGYIGGIVGICNKGCKINNSYSLGKIIDYNGKGGSVKDVCVGGIIGGYRGNVTNCYSLCNVGNYGGALTANDSSGGTPCENSYWTPEISGIESTLFGTNTRLYNMYKQETYTDWDFENVWGIEEESTTPYLKWAGKRDSVKKDNIKMAEGFEPQGDPMEGKGTEVEPYRITTVGQLEDMRFNLQAHYVLENDLDLSEKYGEDKNSWEPIGNSTTNFTGTFDGQFYTINNLYINSTTENTGLFGMLSGSTTSIKNLKLENVDIISTASCTGGLIGKMDGTGKVEKVGVSGKIKGINCTGGVVGWLGNDTIEEVYAECCVESKYDYRGGIVGINNKSCKINNSYSIGEIIGGSNVRVGGIIGGYRGNVTNCYSLCNVQNNGGALTSNDSSWGTPCENSYWAPETSRIESTPFGTKVALSNMFNQSTFENWDFDSVWDIDEGQTTPYLKWVGKRDKITKEYIEANLE